MHLVIDVVAVVDVGALIGEARFDGRVDQLLERALPKDLRRRLEREAVIVSLFMRRSSRLIARYEARKLLGSSTLSSVEFCRIGGTTRARNRSSRLIVLERNCFGNTRKSKLPLPSLPTVSRAKTVIGVLRVLIPEQREEREAQRRVRAAGGKPAILAIADAHTRLGVGRVHAIDDHLRAAVVDVVELRQHGDLRRRQPNLERPSRRRGRLSQAEQHGPHRRHVRPALRRP